MNETPPDAAGEMAVQLLKQSGLSDFLTHLETLQKTLDQVAGGMGTLGENAVRQGKDVENMAAHVLALEAVLTVVLRQIPVDMSEVRAEAERRSGTRGIDDDIVVRLAEDLVRRADD